MGTSIGQTDRQTDKATYWSITVFNEDEIERCKDIANYPYWLHTMYGGLEECPDTKRIHFQGCIQCKSQQRFSAIKKWLPTTHIEVARSPGALKNYSMKEETSLEDKVERVNTRKFLTMSDALTIIGAYNVGVDIMTLVEREGLKDADEALKRMYWNAVKAHLNDDKYDDIGLFSQPQMISAWKNTHSVWVRRAIVLQARPSLEELEFPTPAIPLEQNVGV